MKDGGYKGFSRLGKLFLVLGLGISLIYLPVAAQEETAPAPLAPKLKSESLAHSLSFYGTLIPLAIGLLGVRYAFIGCLIGPSLGYFYGGLPGRALLGIGIRTLGGAAVVAGGIMGLVGFFSVLFGAPPDEMGGTVIAGSLLALGGAILFTGSAVRDISSVKNAVWMRNQRLQGKKLSFAPFYAPSSKTIGIQVQFSF